MPKRRIQIRFRLLASLLLAVAPSFGATDEEGNGVWQPFLTLDFEAALARDIGSGDSAGEQARLARALALLNRQPRTTAGLEEARRELSTLAEQAEDPRVRAVAAYNDVRIDHVYVRSPDFEQVTARYLEVAGRHADQVFGELALAKAMTLELTHVRAGRDVLALAEAWHPRILALRRGAIRRSALVILATALIEDGRDPSRAAAWLDEAGYEDFLRWDFRWRAQLRDIFVSLEAGDRQRARELVQSFKTRYPRSPRIELLEDLASGRLPAP